MRTHSTVAAAALTACFGLLASACGSDDDASEPTDAPPVASTEAPPTDSTDPPPATDAAEPVCPEHVVVQTDWWPELEHGGTYQLIGPNGTADAKNFSYSGPIADDYKVGGVETVEIRAGGDAVSFTPVSSLLTTDDSIMFGYINMSDVIKDSQSAPTVAVAKTLERDPQMIMWDPAEHAVTTPTDIAATGAQVLHFDGTAYIDFMIASGFMTESQSNPSYGGAPTEWIAQGGNFFQQGFATNEVYKYENVIDWKDGAPAPVAFYTVGDLGFDNYAATLNVRADRVEAFAPCLEVLVPAMAQAWIDYLDDPQPITDALIAINETYDTFWQLTAELNARGIELLDELGMSANSPDGTYCSIDPDRVRALYDILKPIYDGSGLTIADDPTATYDNRFCAGAPGR